MTTSLIVKNRRASAAQWAAANPVIPAGELYREVGTGKSKTGDGTTAWDSLPYDIALELEGFVVGPASAGSSNLAEFDGITGKIIKDGGLTHAAVATVVAFSNGQYLHIGNVLDDETFNIPIITNGGRGIMVAGLDEERSDFSIKSDGTVNLIIASANVVANADTDGKFCIGTSVASPCVIKNRLGATKAVMLQLLYN